MTSEQALKMAKAKLECIERQTSGKAELCCNFCENCSLCYEQGNIGEQKEWLKMAIKALEQEPCEDCISRQTVLEYIEGSEAELGHSSENELVCQDIKELPPVTPTRKKGHWIMKHRTHNEMKHYTGQDEMGETHTISVLERYEVDEPYCSECGKLAGDTSQNYCCACGAEMEEVKK